MQGFQVGDFGCSGVDVDAWERENRAPLFPGKLQRWVLVNNGKNPSEPDLKSSLKEAFFFWFNENPLEPFYDTLKIERIARERLTSAARLARREDLKSPPTVIGNAPVWVAVTFAYRGKATNMPWPVRTHTLLPKVGTAARCPVGAEWILDQVSAPSLDDVPPEKTAIEAISEGVPKVFFQTLGLPLLAIAGVLGLYILVQSRK